MKKGYYIFLCGYESTTKEYSGVLKKIEMQCSEFSKFFKIKYIQAFEIRHNGLFYKFTRRLLWNSADRKYDEILQQMDNPSFIYVRRATADKKMISFLQAIKDCYPNCKIILEVYTYPYEQDEYKTVSGKMSMLKDRTFRKKYKDVVDRIVTYTKDDYIFGVKTIPTINGVDTNKFFANSPRAEDNEIHLLGVAIFQKHHGYERILEGMNLYYSNGGTRKVKLFLAGDGPETDMYKNLVNKYNLADKVVFCGKLQGEELNEAYNNADIGLGSFGFYKIGLDSASSLKTKEYLAKGLPVAAGCVEEFIKDEGKKYYIDFPNDSTPVDINRLVEFYDSLYRADECTRQEIAYKIHTYAVKTVSMDVVLNPIVQYIKSDNA